MDVEGRKMNLLLYFRYLFEFMSNDYLDGIVVCLLAFALFGFLLGLTGRRRYIDV